MVWVKEYLITDTVNGKAIMETLHKEIVSAGLPDLVGVTMHNDKIYCEFENALDAGQETTLQTQVNNHIDVFDDSDHIKIHDYVDNNKRNRKKAPKDLNYKTGLNINLHAKRTIVRGEVQKVEWYSDTGLTDKVIDVDIVYTRNPLGFADYRTTTRSWYRKNNTKDPDTKITTKYYSHNPADQMVEARKRRNLLIDVLKVTTMGLITAGKTPAEAAALVAEGRSFMDDHHTEIRMFIDEGNKTDLTTAWTADTNYTWLDDVHNYPSPGNTVRDFLLAEIDI